MVKLRRTKWCANFLDHPVDIRKKAFSLHCGIPRWTKFTWFRLNLAVIKFCSLSQVSDRIFLQSTTYDKTASLLSLEKSMQIRPKSLLRKRLPFNRRRLAVCECMYVVSYSRIFPLALVTLTRWPWHTTLTYISWRCSCHQNWNS